jgi:hypothetical protein
MKTHIVVINGSGTFGKDLFVEYATKYWSTNPTKMVHNYSTIDSIVKMLKRSWNINSEPKTDKYRNLLSAIKNALIEFDDIPTKEVWNYIQTINSTCKYSNSVVIFIHCREPEEIDKIVNSKRYYGRRIAKICHSINTIQIIRANQETPNCVKDDPEFVGNYRYDYTFMVETKQQLQTAAEQFMERLYE